VTLAELTTRSERMRTRIATIELAHYQSQIRHAFGLELPEGRTVLVVPWLGSRLESRGISRRSGSVSEICDYTTREKRRRATRDRTSSSEGVLTPSRRVCGSAFRE